MKTMTCRELGGECDHEIMANIPDDMIKEGIKHMEKYHPDAAEKIKNMKMSDKKQWWNIFLNTWRMTKNNMII